MDNNNDYSNNLNQNLIIEQNQYQTSEEIQNNNLIQLSDDNEPPPPDINFIPLEVSLPPAKLAIEKIPYEGQQNINQPAQQAPRPSRGGQGKQNVKNISSYKKKKSINESTCFIDCFLCLFEVLCPCCGY